MPAPLLAISPTKLAPPEAQDAPHANHCEPLACPPNCPSRPSSIAQPSWPMIQAVSESACRSACTAKATSPADSPRLVLCDLGCQAGSNCLTRYWRRRPDARSKLSRWRAIPSLEASLPGTEFWIGSLRCPQSEERRAIDQPQSTAASAMAGVSAMESALRASSVATCSAVRMLAISRAGSW